MEANCTYYEQGGPGVTDETLRLAESRAEALGIRNVVVASYSGQTGARAVDIFRGRGVIVVGGVYGFREANTVPMQDDHRSVIESGGGKILFAGHAFGMLGRSVRSKFSTMQTDELIAHTLRLISQGVKVACECACMATDAGLIHSGQEVVAVGGTGQGADSAVVLRASNTHTFFDMRILEIICKPRGETDRCQGR